MLSENSAPSASSQLLSFDQLDNFTPQKRLQIIWLENTLDCRTWTYYCDIRDAMARLHDLCIPYRGTLCVDGRHGFKADLIVAGPRYMANVAHEDETLGFDRAAHANLPLVVLQNKMYAASTREIVGDASAKLRWARAAGAVAGFTWLPTQHVEFTRLSGIPHHRMPFGVNANLYGKFANDASPHLRSYDFDIGFTGASSHKYPMREAILNLVRSMSPAVKSYLGTWMQTGLKTTHNNSWKALERDGYVRQISKTKMWVSTTGPSNIVGTRYFEILASGTTLLLCNKAPPGVYDGILEDGVHAVIFDGMADLKAKILFYLANEDARKKIVASALSLTRHIHTWDARALFMTKALEAAVARHAPKATYYVRPAGLLPPPEPYQSCVDARQNLVAFSEVPARRPLRRFTVASCAAACAVRKTTHFAVQCGGFCSGNGHRLAKCFCAKPNYSGIARGRKRRASECATACSLQDPRPCGGLDAVAVYASANSSFHGIGFPEPSPTFGRSPRGRLQGKDSRNARPPWQTGTVRAARRSARDARQATVADKAAFIRATEAVPAAVQHATSSASDTETEGMWATLLAGSK